MKVTIDDIVKETGLSKSTVSRCITNSGSVSESARIKIEAAMRKLGYKAKHTDSFISRCIAIITLDLAVDYSQDTHIRYIQTLTRHFAKLGYYVVTLDCYGKRENLDYYMRTLKRSGIVGIFLLSYAGYSDVPEDIRETGCPIVLVNHYPNTIHLDVVNIDNFAAGFMAGKYLLKNGHTDITILAGTEISATSRNRVWGIKEAYRNNGTPLDDSCILQTDFTYDAGYDFGLHYMETAHTSTAVFCMNSTLAYGIVDAFIHNGKSIPDDLSLICTDYRPSPKRSGLILTTLCHDDVAIATAAADLLVERIEQPEGTKKNLVFSPVFQEGNTVKDISGNTQ